MILMISEAPAYPALKNMFDRARFEHIALQASTVWAPFDRARFIAMACDNLDRLGIMERMRQTATSLRATLPDEYPHALDILADLSPRIGHPFVGISLSEYVALYGLGDFDRSMAALRYFTQFGSAEFAIRHFLLADPDRALAIMRGWADDENEHVRRLASEGARPRLPWSFQLKALQSDPKLAWPILERMKADPSLYVRKSVANHLNDISKDHPDWLVDRLVGWDQSIQETKWIVRQAMRTRVKKGDLRALALIGSTGKADIKVGRFTVAPAALTLGERITLKASLVSNANHAQRIIIDYAIIYVKKGEKLSRKVFKLKELELPPAAAVDVSISQVIRDFTTRKHYPGWHQVQLMANGEVVAVSGFELR